jgi:hypothetical protein
MSRQLSRVAIAAVTAAVVAAGVARAQPQDPPADPLPAEAGSATPPPPDLTVPPPPPSVAATAPALDDTLADQMISAEAGLVTGGRVTPGGLRIAGHYLYQLSDRDWFDGMAAFTFGSGQGGCFRDRQDMVICKHGVADGTGVEIAARIRRLLAPHNVFHPFAQLGVGLGLARFSDDQLSGFTIPLHAGGGVRVKVAPTMSLVVEDELEFGFGVFGRGLGIEPQLGFAITAGIEFELR